MQIVTNFTSPNYGNTFYGKYILKWYLIDSRHREVYYLSIKC